MEGGSSRAGIRDRVGDHGLPFPPGTSKWNKIEHRLFSQITMNWRGRPLTSHEVVVKTIASTRTRTGLRVDAELDTGDYPIGISVGRDELRALPIRPHAQCGAWNYTIEPAHADAAPVPGRDRERERAAAVETGWPCRVSSSARCRSDLVVHRNGDSGSPRSSGSTSVNNAGTSCGFSASAPLRPPPGRRTRPVGAGCSPASNSNTPLRTVVSLTPTARATARTPPWPSDRASVANAKRR